MLNDRAAVVLIDPTEPAKRWFARDLSRPRVSPPAAQNSLLSRQPCVSYVPVDLSH